MKKSGHLIAIFAALVLGVSSLNAQETFKDWHDIDEITIYKYLNYKDCGTLYILPADETVCEFHDDNKNVVAQVNKQMEAFRPMIKKECKNLDVKIVDSLPDNLQANDLVMQIRYVTFDLGSMAARVWAGFGAGHAETTINFVVKDGENNMIFEVNQKHLSGGNPFADMRYHKILADMHKNFAKDIAVIFSTLDKVKK